MFLEFDGGDEAFWILANSYEKGGMPGSFIPKDRPAKHVHGWRQKIQGVVFPTVKQYSRLDRRWPEGRFLSHECVDQMWKLRVAHASMEKVNVDITVEAARGQAEPVAGTAKRVKQDLALVLIIQRYAKRVLDVWVDSVPIISISLTKRVSD